MAEEKILEILDILVILSGTDELRGKLRDEEADKYISDKISEKNEADEGWLDRYAVSLLAWHCMPTLLQIKPANLVHIRKRLAGKSSELIAIIKEYAEVFSCSCSCLYESNTAVSLLVYNRQMLKELLADREVRDYLVSCGYSICGSSVARDHTRLTESRSEVGLYDVSENRSAVGERSIAENGRIAESNSIAKDHGITEDWLEAVLNCWKQRYADYFRCRANLQISHSDSEQGGTVVAFPHEIGLLLGYPLKDVKAFVENSGKNYLLSGYWKVYHDKERALGIFETYTRVRRHTLEILKAGGGLKDISAMNRSDFLNRP